MITDANTNYSTMQSRIQTLALSFQTNDKQQIAHLGPTLRRLHSALDALCNVFPPGGVETALCDEGRRMQNRPKRAKLLKHTRLAVKDVSRYSTNQHCAALLGGKTG